MDLKSLDRYFLIGESDQKNHQRLFNLDLLQEFLIENGCINPTTSFFHCQVYLYQQYHGQTRKKKRSLTEAELHLMIALVSGTFDLFDARLRMTTDTETNQSQMTHPLTDYFIASSATSESILSAVNRSRKWKLHLLSDFAKKSYLLKQYRKLLEAGCRCLEIEVWDNRDVRQIRNQKKGSTDSLLISLSSVLTEINSFAVAQQNLKEGVAHLPIILSIDIKGRRLSHSTEAQEKLAHQLKSIFKERLYTEPVETHSLIGLTNYFTTYPLKDDLNFQNLLQSTAFNETISADESTFWKVFSADTAGESSESAESADSNKSPAQPPTASIDHLSTLTQSRLVHVYKDITIPDQIYDPLRLWAAGVQLVSQEEFAVEVKLYGSSAHCTYPITRPFEWSTRLLDAKTEAVFEANCPGGHGRLMVLTWNESAQLPPSLTTAHHRSDLCSLQAGTKWTAVREKDDCSEGDADGIPINQADRHSQCKYEAIQKKQQKSRNFGGQCAASKFR
ncbi:phosphatidylinositol phospholipase C [Tyrophagus putrescentiae]|nr:phosphatidylinositol phospholipase C [Tyrophagus putrescentiae]